MVVLAALKLFGDIYQDRNVLITGHTGFKGSWLAFWLNSMGAKVAGYALQPPTEPNHFELLHLKHQVTSMTGDVGNRKKLFQFFAAQQPEVVFHLAAQALVRKSYQEPVETFDTNVLGTVNVLEACRLTPSVKAIIIVTSDKCYENKEWVWGYRENDPMGGYDPYSASKGCAELVTASYRYAFFHPRDYGKKHEVLLASTRAGNVVGGGDWADDRLIPDIVKATAKEETVIIRSPAAVRPWQHVLEPLSGYLEVGRHLLEKNIQAASAWNFGPSAGGTLTVEEVVEQLQRSWQKIAYQCQPDPDSPHEAHLLTLDCSKAHRLLKWQEVWDGRTTLQRTAEWYRRFYEKKEICSQEDLEVYVMAARSKNLAWTSQE